MAFNLRIFLRFCLIKIEELPSLSIDEKITLCCSESFQLLTKANENDFLINKFII
jgi:hypothetical protein